MAGKSMNGSEIIIQALLNEGVDTVFGYPGGAVLPIYDAIFQQISFGTFSFAKKAVLCTWRKVTPGPRERSVSFLLRLVPAQQTPLPG